MENNRILVIDDEPKVHQVYQDILSASSQRKEQDVLLDQEAAVLFGQKTAPSGSGRLKRSFEVSFAFQGEEGLELVKKSLSENKPFAAAFIDVRMPPGWDGIKTATEIRKVDKDIEEVIVTAYADKSLDEIIADVGMPERLLYIKKPFVQDEIWQLANALSAKWNLQEKERSYRQALEGIVRTLSHLRNIPPVDMISLLKYILQEIAELCNSEDAFFFMVNNLGDSVDVEYRFGIGKFSSDEAIDDIFKKCSLMDNLIGILDKNEFCKISNLVMVPFRLEAKKYIFAAVAIEDKEPEEHKRFLQIFVENALIALQNARLYQNLEEVNLNLEQKIKERTEELRLKTQVLEKMAKQDLLTGFYNHVTLFELFEKEYYKALRYKLDLSCAMADLDCFKTINDKYGHFFGDGTLKIIAELIAENVRVGDIIGRYGGDEFVIVFPNTNLDSALNACERIRQKLENLRVPVSKKEESPLILTASFGIVALNLEEPVGSERLIEQADEAMYEAKKAGRNCVYPFKKIIRSP